MQKPIPLENIDTESIKSICQEYIDFVGSDDFHEDNDYTEYIFEAAMIAVFGDKVFDYINEKL